MNQSSVERCLIVFFRLAMGWTFLYAASHQVFVPGWSVAGFLNNTKTFHDLFAYFATPTMEPITSLFVSYGHLLIGVSLILGLMTRVSAGFHYVRSSETVRPADLLDMRALTGLIAGVPMLSSEEEKRDASMP